MNLRQLMTDLRFIAFKMVEDNEVYSLLQSDPSTPLDVIAKRYRKLSLKYHPDKTKGDETKSKVLVLMVDEGSLDVLKSC